jgi:pyrimidine-nucleoside phosphorylase
VSIALAPIAAACGLYVPMLSGRGLGHTGGTLDKLEAIPGFRTRLDEVEFERVLRSVGCVMGGQSAALAPADGRIYALRDATATVESLPLIISSILSKKIAAGPRVLVLDVKTGRGAFLKTIEDARELARGLVRVAGRFGRRAVAFLTDMDVPLGRAIGNGLEVAEAIDLLQGREVARDFDELTRVLTCAMLVGAGRAASMEAARDLVRDAIDSGRAFDRLLALVEAQGGSRDAVARRALPEAPVRTTVRADRAGSTAGADPLALAEIVLEMGGGRRDLADTIDHTVGLWLHRRPGEAVAVGDPLVDLHLAAGSDADRLCARARAAIAIGPAPYSAPLIREVVGPGGEVPWRGWATALPL